MVEMNFTQSFPITIVASTVCLMTGTVSKQPLLRELGEIAALGAISRKMIVKQQQLNANNQKQLTLLNKENTCLQAKLVDTQNELNKLDKKIKNQNTSQRLYISKIDKLQHQQKLLTGDISQLQKKLEVRIQESVVRSQNASIGAMPCAPTSRTASLKSLPSTPASVTRVYIDGNNFSFALDKLQIEADYNALRVELSQHATASTFKYYTGVYSPMTEGQKRFTSYLSSIRYEVIGLPILPRPDSHTIKTVGDDVKIAVDMLMEVKQHDRVILVSGDGDFVPAIAELKRRGAAVTVIAKKGMLSQQLAEIADELIFLDDLQYKIAKYTKLSVA
jgi:uncharacterized LabA/DUF88 family protein